MKVEELKDRLLDFWVAMALEDKPYYETNHPQYLYWLKYGEYRGAKQTPYYSKYWEDGGPIIHANKITVEYEDGEGWCAYIHNFDDYGRADLFYNEGDTPLIAAMRCFVEKKLGQEVEDLPS